jgi:hypothetical protein
MPIPGQTNSVLALMNLQFSDSGLYDAVLSCSYGSVTSRLAQIDVRQPPRLTSRLNNGRLQITVSDGTPGRYRIESFTNAVTPWIWDWTNHVVIDIPSMPHTIDLPINPLDRTRYYRLAAE